MMSDSRSLVRVIDPSDPKPEDLPFINEIIKENEKRIKENPDERADYLYISEMDKKDGDDVPYEINGQKVELTYPLLNFSGEYWVNKSTGNYSTGSNSKVFEVNHVYKLKDNNYQLEASEAMIKERLFSPKRFMNTPFQFEESYFGILNRETAMLKAIGDSQADMIRPQNSRQTFQKMSKAKGLILTDYLLQNPDLTLQDRLELIKLINAEVQKLHEKQIAHLDLKPDNIFFDPISHKITIVDYDSAVDAKTKMEEVKSVTDRFYTPPDKISGTPQDIDRFSLSGVYGTIMSDWRQIAAESKKDFYRDWSHLPLFNKSEIEDPDPELGNTKPKEKKTKLKKYETVMETGEVYEYPYHFETFRTKNQLHPNLQDHVPIVTKVIYGIGFLGAHNFSERISLASFDAIIKEAENSLKKEMEPEPKEIKQTVPNQATSQTESPITSSKSEEDIKQTQLNQPSPPLETHIKSSKLEKTQPTIVSTQTPIDPPIKKLTDASLSDVEKLQLLISIPIDKLMDKKEYRKKLAESLEAFVNDKAVIKSQKSEVLHLKSVYNKLTENPLSNDAINYLKNENKSVMTILKDIIIQSEERQRYHVGSSKVMTAMQNKISVHILSQLPDEFKNKIKTAKQTIVGRTSNFFGKKTTELHERVSRMSRSSRGSNEEVKEVKNPLMKLKLKP